MLQIRKTGKYIATKVERKKIKQLNEKMGNLKEEINFHRKAEFVPSENGYIYINKNNITKDGKKITCYKIGYALSMENRLSTYKTGNFRHTLLAYIPLNIDRRAVESAIKAKLQTHRLNSNSDTICYVALSKLKKEIIETIQELQDHICYCNHCSKAYKFNNINRHKCNKPIQLIENTRSVSQKKTTKRVVSQRKKSRKPRTSRVKPKYKSV